MKKSEFVEILRTKCDDAETRAQSGDVKEAAKGQSDLEFWGMIGHIVSGFDPEQDAAPDETTTGKSGTK